jgi:hypothetical protein
VCLKWDVKIRTSEWKVNIPKESSVWDVNIPHVEN